MGEANHTAPTSLNLLTVH